ncbi:MAG: hypothetical protein Dbin4_02954 [Alphaproteobacteria bacterium]|nr:hypothetical protein [Alphaproteobacteria bacterium]
MSKKINEEDILALFFKEPEEHHVREVARRCKLTPSTASKYLEQFAKQGLLRKREALGSSRNGRAAQTVINHQAHRI